MERVNHIEGNLSAAGRSFGIVASRFNDFVVKALLEGAIEAIRRHGGVAEAVDVVWVPGSYEIPVVARELAVSGRYDAIICLGAVIRGATAHFDYVAGGAAGGISNCRPRARGPVPMRKAARSSWPTRTAAAGTICSCSAAWPR